MQKKKNLPRQSAFTNKALASQNQLGRAYALHQQGNLTQAKAAYLEALKLDSRNYEALQLIGTLCAQSKQSEEALAYFDKALEVNAANAAVFNNRGMVLMDLKNPLLAIQSFERAIALQIDYAEAHANKGNALQASQQLKEALKSYECAIALRPGFADTYINKGVVLHKLESFQTAIESFNRAARITPTFAQAFYNTARAFRQLGDLKAALANYDRAIDINADYIDAHNNRGNILLELKDFNLALESFDKALVLNSRAPQLHNNKGNVLRELKRFNEAIQSYKTAIQIYPQYVDAYNNLGNVFQELKQFNDALICYNQALTYNPQFVDALSNKGVVLRELKDSRASVECYGQAIMLNPQFAQAYFNLGNALKELDMPTPAQIYYERALMIDSKYYGAKWGIALLNIPTFINSTEHLESSRISLNTALKHLQLECSDSGFLNAFQSVGLHQPFYLAYQERNNKELMQQYAQICHTVMAHWQSTYLADILHSTKSQKIKLGIVSDQIRFHSVWNAITKGIIEHLDSEKFEIHIFYLGTVVDEQTAFAQSKTFSFTQNLPSLKEWAYALQSSNLDAILYPEIGMHALTLQLAHLRLAPLQMVSWGHPETTGIETIDYFISAQSFEDKSSKNYYSESLLELPSLGCTYGELEIKPETVDLHSLGVLSDSIKLLCPGTLFKYSPEYDWIFAAIAKELQLKEVGDLSAPVKYQFIFLYRDTASAELFKARLEKVFEAERLDISAWVVFLPWMSPSSFYGLMNCVDLFLDTLGFSGFNTAMQAVECALPIVTKRGQFLRGRFASAILDKLNLETYVANSDNQYISNAVMLATQPELRAKVSSHIRSNRHTLFNDLTPVRAFEEFLIKRCRSKS